MRVPQLSSNRLAQILLRTSAHLWAGADPPTPLLLYLRCTDCRTGFYGVPLLRKPLCSSCLTGTLEEIGQWDLRFQAWPMMQVGKGQL
jgi:hypothetical protein